jgi:hypothetical protein
MKMSETDFLKSHRINRISPLDSAKKRSAEEPREFMGGPSFGPPSGEPWSHLGGKMN